MTLEQRDRKIYELRTKYKLEFTDIGRRFGITPSAAGYAFQREVERRK